MLGLIKDKKTAIYFVLLALIIIFAQSYAKSLRFDFGYAFYPDSTDQYYLQGLNDNSLFANSPFVPAYLKSLNWRGRDALFPGIYYFLQKMFPLPIAMKIVSFFVCFLSMVLKFKIWEFLTGKESAFFITGSTMIYLLASSTFYGGKMRGFGMLIFIMFLFLLTKKRFLLVPLLLVLTVFFYPYIFVSLCFACMLVPLFYKELKRLKAYVLIFITSVLASVFFIIGKNQGIYLETIFKKVDLFGTYKYTLLVKKAIDIHDPVQIIMYFVLNLNEHGYYYFYFTVFLLILALIFLITRKGFLDVLPKGFCPLIIGSAISFILIYPIHPISASRQFVFSVPLLIISFVSINVYNIIKCKMSPAWVLMPLVSVFFILQPKLLEIRDYSKFKPAYAYFENLPKDILIAGYPKSELIQSISFFAKRTVFYVDNQSEMFYVSLSPDECISMRRSLVKALFSDSLISVNEFVNKYHVDYLVVESRIYENRYSELLKWSPFPGDRSTSEVIRSKNHLGDYPLLKFVQQNYDFMFKLPGNDIYIINAGKIKQNLSGE